MGFARLSKSSLIQLIGVTPNHYYFEDVIMTSKVQILSEQCVMCPNYALSCQIGDCEHFCTKCKNCPHYQYENIHSTEKKKIYKSEKKKYGVKSSLGFASIKVWIALHFCKPDLMGLVTTSVRDLEDITGLERRRIRRALKNLQKHDYIVYSAAQKSYNQLFMVMITGYEKMHLSAKEGGTGYVTFSSENLSGLRAIQKVNELRTYLRVYLSCDDTAVKKKDVIKSTAKISKETIKKWLPDYLTFANIDALINKMRGFFKVSSPSESQERFFDFSLCPETNGRLVYSCRLQESIEDISEFFNEINKLVTYEHDELTRNEDILHMQQIGILKGTRKNWENKTVLVPDDQSLIDLARLSIEYGFLAVKNAICDIVKQYHFADKKIISWGALARKIIQLDAA